MSYTYSFDGLDQANVNEPFNPEATACGSGNESIEMYVDGNLIAAENLGLRSDDCVTVNPGSGSGLDSASFYSLEFGEITFTRAGEYTFEIGNETKQISVKDADISVGCGSIPDSVTGGDTFTVSAEAQNTGPEEGLVGVALLLNGRRKQLLEDGEQQDGKVVSVPGNDTRYVEFEIRLLDSASDDLSIGFEKLPADAI